MVERIGELWREKKIESPVIIKVRHTQSALTGQISSLIGHPRNYRDIPIPSVVFVSDTDNIAIFLYRDHIQNTVVVRIRHIDRFYHRQATRQRPERHGPRTRSRRPPRSAR